MFFLALSKKTHKINKQKINTKDAKQNETKIHKKIIEPVLCCLATPDHGSCPSMYLIHPMTLYWRKMIFPFPSGYQLQMTSNLHDLGWDSVHYSFSVLVPSLAWTFAALCMLPQSLSFYVEDTLPGLLHPFRLWQSFWLLLPVAPWSPRGGVWGRHPTKGWILQSLSLSAHYPVVGLCVNSHLITRRSLSKEGCFFYLNELFTASHRF